MAANRSLGTLSIDLLAKIGGFEVGMDRAARVADKRMKDIQKSVTGGITGALNSLAALGAGFLSVSTIIQGFKGAIDQADKLNDFTIRLGVSAEAISAWGYAASQTGTDVDTLGKGLKLLQDNMAKALDPKSSQSNLFKTLGIDVKDAQGNLRELESILPEIADKFKTLDNDATETALAIDLFGSKSGTQLLEFLNAGAEGLDEFTAKARDLGIVLSQETLTAADNFNDAIGDLKTATQGAIYQALQPMLPVLQELVQEMVNFAKSGDGARQAGEEAAGGITAIGTAAKSVYSFLVGLREGLAAFEQQARGYTTLVLGGGASSIAQIEQSAKRLDKVFNGVFDASKTGTGAAKALDPIDTRLKVDFKSLDQQAKDIAEATKKRQALQDAVNGYLGNPTGKTAKAPKAKTGKSEEEKQAERLAKAIRQMADEQREWQIILDDQGNPIAKEYANRLADITDKAEKFKQDGIPTPEIEAFVAKMKELATAIQSKELTEFQKEFSDSTLEMAASLQGPGAAGLVAYRIAVEELDKQLKKGLITQQQYTERMEAMTTPFEDVVTGLQLEAEAIARTAQEQEIYNQQKLAGVDAMSEEGIAIAQMVKNNELLAESYGFVNDAKSELADAFSDFITGAKSAKEAFGDFADSIYKKAIQLLANKAVDALFEAFSGTGASSTGSTGTGGWAALFSSFFGGARAGGGNVNSGMVYAVNEQGPELLTVGNRDYLMMGNQSGKVTPNSRLSGVGGRTSITNVYVQPTSTRRTAQQVATATERMQTRDTYRNR